MLVLHTDPVYPQEAKAANVRGSVDVLVTIGKDGVPRELRATRGDPRLAAAAIAAISQWRYRPAMLNGQLEESLITVTVSFTP
jgi:protein TonB